MTYWEKKDIFCAYKKVGETPLELIKRIKDAYPELESERIAYAGRLDPMAEGVVLFVKGKELENFDNYLKLDKEYEAEIIFGIKTDTYDMLGLPERVKATNLKREEVEHSFLSHEGVFSFLIPPFSGYKIKKRPLFWWALSGRLGEIKIPKKSVRIYKIDFLDFYKKNGLTAEKEVIQKINRVKGSFRQDEIKKKWRSKLKKEDNFQMARIRVKCSSGFYVRSMAMKIGKELKTGGALFSLKRTSVGNFNEASVLDL